MVAPFAAAVTVAVDAAAICPAVTEKLAVVAPAATVVDAGVDSSALLSERVTSVPPLGAAALKLIVQLLLPLETSLAGVQLNVFGTAGARSPRAKETAVPFRLALMFAVLAVVIAKAAAVKTAVLAPAATVTDAGVVSIALLSESATTAPPLGAALFSVTVQLLTAKETSVPGLHVNPVGIVGARRPSEKLAEEPPKLAVIDAVLAAVTAEIVAANVAVVLPAATVTEAGIVTAALLSVSATSAPPVGAAPVKVTVHVAVEGPVTDAGLQLTVDTPTEDGTVIRPPVAEAVTGIAPVEAEDNFVI